MCRCGERMRNRRDDDGAQERGEACGGEHRDIAIAAHDHHHRRYQDRHDEREQVTEQVTRGERAADYHDGTDERHEAGDPGLANRRENATAFTPDDVTGDEAAAKQGAPEQNRPDVEVDEPGQAESDGRCRDQRGAGPSPAAVVCGRECHHDGRCVRRHGDQSRQSRGGRQNHWYIS